MTVLLKEQIKQLSSYLSNVLTDGLDVTALYIIQAQLTTIKASVRPSHLLMNSFSNFQIKKILTYTKDYFQRLRYKSTSENLQQPQSYNDDLIRFNVSLRDLEEKPIQEISIVSGRIMQTLEQWNNLESKTENLRQKLGTLTQYSLCLADDESLKEQLQSLICLIDISSLDKQIRINTESTESFTASVDSQLTQSVRQLKVTDIACFLRSILVWSKDILQEIAQFVQLIEMIKAETSFDLESQYDQRFSRNLKALPNNYLSTSGSSALKPRQSNITDKIEKIKEKQAKNSNVLPKKRKFSNNTGARNSSNSFQPTNILSNIDWHNSNKNRKSYRRQKAAPGPQKTCHQCQIY